MIEAVRTDRHFLCIACRARTSDARACPLCGGAAALVDVRDEAARERAFRQLRRSPRTRGGASWIGLDRAQRRTRARSHGLAALVVVLALTLAAPAAAPALFGVSPVTAVLAILLAVLVFVLGRHLHRTFTAMRDAALELSVAEAPRPVAEDARVTIRGRVRLLEPLVAPLTGTPCAGYRLVGETRGGAVDDAWIGTFEIVGDEGGPVRVEPGGATLDVAVASPLRDVTPTAALRAFLDARGLFPGDLPTMLAEATIEDGAEVELVGALEDATLARGYRATEAVRVARDRADAPLVIRRR